MRNVAHLFMLSFLMFSQYSDKHMNQSHNCERMCRFSYWFCTNQCMDPSCWDSCRVEYRSCLELCGQSETES